MNLVEEREMREVYIFWRDEPEDCAPMFATVVVDGDWTDGLDDDNIFYYFRDIHEYNDALLNGTHEFRMEEVQ
jgi:hypothetical protein